MSEVPIPGQSNQSSEQGQRPGVVGVVEGAFEIFEGKRETLLTETTKGRLPQVGDQIPMIPGVDLTKKLTLLSSVNDPKTPVCDTQIRQLEGLHRKYPDVQVVTLTMRDPDEKQIEGNEKVTHPIVKIDNDKARDLGIALKPGEGADPEAWANTLRRTIMVVDSNRTIVHVEQPNDQEVIPNFDSALAVVLGNQPK